MEIIKRGPTINEKSYQATCYNCKSLIRFRGSESENHVDSTGRTWGIISCPVCRWNISHPLS